jgi:hypothetical protein
MEKTTTIIGNKDEINKRIIILLSVLVIIHSIFGIASVTTMLTFFYDKDIPIADYLSGLSVISFIFFNKCLAIDIYDYCKGDINPEKLPEYCKDNYIRKKIHKLNGCDFSEDHTYLRLDKIKNLTPLKECSNNNGDFELFFNRKIQYIVFNIILTIILAVKYKIKEYLPLLLLWVFFTFPA